MLGMFDRDGYNRFFTCRSTSVDRQASGDGKRGEVLY